MDNNIGSQTLRGSIYPIVLAQVRKIMIPRMAKPMEVLIVIDETGNPKREVLENTENNSLYEIMKELMINLAKLDWENMKNVLVSKLES